MRTADEGRVTKETPMNKSKWFLCAALALTGTLGTGMAQAQTPHVQWSITIGTPVYVRPAPVIVQPLPVYRLPVPVRVQPFPVYPRGAYWRPTRWDRDGDGIPNRHDRRYNPRWDRDGDGKPNRDDRHDDRRWPGR
jgi:hypothetical protein